MFPGARLCISKDPHVKLRAKSSLVPGDETVSYTYFCSPLGHKSLSSGS